MSFFGFGKPKTQPNATQPPRMEGDPLKSPEAIEAAKQKLVIDAPRVGDLVAARELEVSKVTEETPAAQAAEAVAPQPTPEATNMPEIANPTADQTQINQVPPIAPRN